MIEVSTPDHHIPTVNGFNSPTLPCPRGRPSKKTYDKITGQWTRKRWGWSSRPMDPLGVCLCHPRAGDESKLGLTTHDDVVVGEKLTLIGRVFPRC